MNAHWFSIKGFNSVTFGFIVFSVTLSILFIFCVAFVGCYEFVFPKIDAFHYNAPLRRSRNRAIRRSKSRQSKLPVRLNKNKNITINNASISKEIIGISDGKKIDIKQFGRLNNAFIV